MRSIIAAAAVSVILSGCSVGALDATTGVLGLIAGDTVVHKGVVERVEYGPDSTTIHFVDRVSYELPGRVCCPAPGAEGAIIEDGNGHLDFD